MAAGIDWLRLWHDMPNDPKWRTIARASGQPIALVLSTYLHLLVDASRGVSACHEESRSVTRGVTDVTDEDIASALDVSDDAIRAIREAMQGRVLDGNKLTGWDRRQPKREDVGNPETGAKSSTQRKREQRERERAERDATSGHAASRDVTKSHDREEKSKEEINNPPNPPSPAGDDGAEKTDEKKSKRERKPRTALKTFLAACKANGVKPVTTYAPLMEYVEGVGLPADFLELAWDVFCHEHLDGGANAARLQADWQRHFANYVTKGYYRLWVCKADGTFELTSTGQQARRFHKQEAA